MDFEKPGILEPDNILDTRKARWSPAWLPVVALHISRAPLLARITYLGATTQRSTGNANHFRIRRYHMVDCT
jgi:hypothetical protein